MDGPLSRHLSRFADPVAVPAVPLPRPAEAACADRLAACHAEIATLHDKLRQAEDARAAAAAQDGLAFDAAVQAAVAVARAEWAASSAAQLGAQLDAAAATLREELGRRIADALRPLLAQAVVTRTLACLVAALDRLLDDPAHPGVTVRGPADLLCALRAVRGEAVGVAFVEADEAEVTMTADGATVQTRLAAALAALGQAAGGHA